MAALLLLFQRKNIVLPQKVFLLILFFRRCLKNGNMTKGEKFCRQMKPV